MIGGFSQGGYLALALAGRPKAPAFGGLWVMCCAMPDIEGLELDFGSGRGRPALVQYGTRDPFIPTEATLAAAETLTGSGWEVQAEGYDMDHSQRLEMMMDARRFLGDIG